MSGGTSVIKLYDKSKLVRVEILHISTGNVVNSLEERSSDVRVREEILGEMLDRKLLDKFHDFVDVSV